jgi:hypothetical protein
MFDPFHLCDRLAVRVVAVDPWRCIRHDECMDVTADPVRQLPYGWALALKTAAVLAALCCITLLWNGMSDGFFLWPLFAVWMLEVTGIGWLVPALVAMLYYRTFKLGLIAPAIVAITFAGALPISRTAFRRARWTRVRRPVTGSSGTGISTGPGTGSPKRSERCRPEIGLAGFVPVNVRHSADVDLATQTAKVTRAPCDAA